MNRARTSAILFRSAKPVALVLLMVFGVRRVIAEAPQQQKLVDQIVALVNDEIITRTDLLWSLAMDPSAPSPSGPIGPDLLRQKLEVMIDERLISQEAERLPGAEIPQEEVDKKRTELISRFASEAAFRQRIESVGLTPDRLDQLIRQRILIDRFIAFRFRSFTFVSEQELQRYYDERLVPEVRRKGQIPPPLEQVRAETIDFLKEEKTNQEIDRWLAEIRQRADIVLLAEP